MRILIDGDGCPVVDLTIKIAKEYNVEVLFYGIHLTFLIKMELKQWYFRKAMTQ